MRILREAKAAGLAQTGGNVRSEVSYLCNCCGMMRSIKSYGISNAIVSSNWRATIYLCRGCSECAKAPPAGATAVVPSEGKGLRKDRAMLDPAGCIGRGVCRWDAHGMEPRAERPHFPADTLERVASMAVERGKLVDFLLANSDARLGQAVARGMRALEQLPPWKAAPAIEPLRSTFLQGVVGTARRLTATREPGRAGER